MKFKLRFPPSAIEKWAGQYSDPVDAEIENVVAPAARRQGYLTREQFLAIAEWKTARSRSRCQKNEAFVREVTRAALASRGTPKSRCALLTGRCGSTRRRGSRAIVPAHVDHHDTRLSFRRGNRPTVANTPDADYGYRLTTSRELLASYLAESVDALDYPNFKARVAEGHPRRAHIYMSVWAALGELRKIGAKGGSP